MKTRGIWILTLLLWSLSVGLYAQSYDRLWKQIERWEKKDLPRSVVNEAQKVYDKAKAERNVPQMMKAYLTLMTWRGEISPDSMAMDVRRLEVWAADPQTQPTDRAVLNSILGELTLDKDFEKGNRYLALSLKDSLALADYPAEKLVPMVVTGETSRLYFDNNLYDLLAHRAIRLWEQHRWRLEQDSILRSVRQTWQSLLHIYRMKNLREAWLLTALGAYPEADETQLRKWTDEYGDLDVCAEVYLRRAMRIRNKRPDESLALLREGIHRYPHYSRIRALINEEKEILLPALRFSVTDFFPDRPIRMPVTYRNLSGFTTSIYRLNLSADSPDLSRVSPENVTKHGTLLKRQHHDLPSTPHYQNRKDTLLLEALSAGIYYLVGMPDGHRDISQGALLHVTGLHILYRSPAAHRREIVVLDKQSGRPVPGAQVRVYTERDGRFRQDNAYIADADGTVTITDVKSRSCCLQARTATDSAMAVTPARMNGYRPERAADRQEHMYLFTDRALYRPGQTLHFAGIAYSQRQDSVRVEEEAAFAVTLLDADRKEVAKCEVKTDAFGTFRGQFSLPRSGKTGVYRLQTPQGATSFRVEEYKRPTFEVTFDTVRTAYRPGDSLRLTGRACTLDGVPVQGAKVSYRIVRSENGLGRMAGVETLRVTGTAETDEWGRFEVPVRLLPVTNDMRGGYCIYRVSADVTALSGETQTGRLDLPSGGSSLQLNIPDWSEANLLKEHLQPLNFQVRNRLNVPVRTEVTYRVSVRGRQVWQGKAFSNEPFTPQALCALPSGRYRLEAEVADESGRQVRQTVNFTLLSLSDKHLPEGTKAWGWQSGDTFDADGKATVCFGSSEQEVYLFCDVMYGDNRLESKRITFSDSLLAFHYTYREEYGDGLRCCFAFVKDGDLYVRNFYIKKPAPDKALRLKWKTFRDKLRPGRHETWTLSVLRPDGTPADARLMATLYDASLDALASRDRTFALHFDRRFPSVVWRQTTARPVYLGFPFSVNRLKVSPLTYSSLDIPHRSYAYSRMRTYQSNLLATGATAEAIETAQPEKALFAAEASGEEALARPLSVRSDFAETAFFYPQLRTDDSGEVRIEFTLPESLTEWRFIGLAHTRDLDYGTLTATVRASKDFMLRPRWPRFVRVGDEASVSASLVNLSDKEVSGDVRLELFHPHTGQVYEKKKQRFLVAPSSTVAVNFGFGVTDRCDTLAVRMVADGGTFSDGEQCILPVHSDKQWLTESVLLDVNGAGTYTFPLKSLFNDHSSTVSHPQLAVRFTGNPVWYAVEALPVLANPDSRDALSWAVAYYANRLTRFLVRQHPSIARVVRTDSLAHRLREAEAQLKKLQNEDGSWSWYPGMSGSRYMTAWIALSLARLQSLTAGEALDAEVMAMYRRAMTRLATEVRKEYEWARKTGWQEEYCLSELVLQYLYICALDADAPKDKRVNTFFIDRLTSSGCPVELTIYGKSLAAIILHEAGRTAKAGELIRSVLQYSVLTEGMGRYFDTPRAEQTWFSYRLPTQVAVMEAVRRLTGEEQTLEELKRWLLKQKQGQTWDNPLTAADAVYALLTTGADGLAHGCEAEIRLGGRVIHASDTLAGTVGDTLSGQVMDIREVQVKKTSSGLGWGAVYARFREEPNKVKTQCAGLTVTRTLWRNGRPLAEGEACGVGDRLTIRLTLTAERNLDFVQLTDERAACMEPAETLSGYRWKDGQGYYFEPKDASASFFFDHLHKGTRTVEYEVFLHSAGTYRQGIATVRSVYAPEFGGHGAGDAPIRVKR